MSDIKEFSSSDVLEALVEEVVDTSEQVIKNTEDKTVEKVVEPVKVEEPVAVVESVKKPVVEAPVRVRRAKDDVGIHLENLKNADTGGLRIAAWSKIIDIVVKYPKKNVFDEIYTFMKNNKSEEFLSEAVALQNITSVEVTMHHRIRIFYTVMIGLARKTANRRNTSIEVIRNIFSSDEFANWVAIQLDKRR